jgi:hypothetical protein
MWALLMLLHWLLGFILLQRWFKALSGNERVALAYPLGLGTATLIVFLLEVAGITILWSTEVAVVLTLMLMLIPSNGKIPLLNIPKPNPKKIRIQFTDVIFLLPVAALCFISFWRAYYLPVTPYDAIVGIDLVAKYALLDGKIASRVFSDLAGQMTTQPYYAPFAMLSQFLYRSAGHPFGQVWLGALTISFVGIFYLNFRRILHPVLAGILTILLLAMPEMFAYTFMVQTDFPNAVFVSIGVLYLYRYLKEGSDSYFWLGALMWGLGCWSRSETIAFAVMTAMLLALFLKPNLDKRRIAMLAAFVGINVLFFAAWNLYYLPYVLNYQPDSVFKFFFWDAQRLSDLFSGMLKIWFTANYWSYLPHIFLIAVVFDVVRYRDCRNLFLLIWLVAFFVVFLLLLYHLQLNLYANIHYTFRRGLFKFWPVVTYYLATTTTLQHFSDKLKKWETS